MRLSNPPPGVTVTVTGSAAFSQEMGAEMGGSMGMLIGAALLLMVIAVGLLFGHVRHRFLSVGIVAAGLILTFGIVGWTSLQINMATIAAFPVLIGIGIDYAIQFHSRFDEEARRTTLPEAVRLTVTRSGPSILYAMLATSIGFIALWVSPLPMIRSFGVVCTIGVMACYLVALVSVPAVGLLTNYTPKAIAHGTTRSGSEKPTVEETYNTLLGRLASKVAHHPVPVLVLVGLVALVGFSLDERDPDLDRRGHLRAQGHAGPDQPGEGEPDHGLDRVHADLRPGRPRPLARGDPMDARVRGVRARPQLEHPRRDLDRDRDRPVERRSRADDPERGRRGPRPDPRGDAAAVHLRVDRGRDRLLHGRDVEHQGARP